MRLYLTLVALLLLAGAARAQAINLDTGLWQITTDVYMETTEGKVKTTDPPIREEITECWTTPAETTLDPSLLGEMEGCVPGEASWTAYGMSVPLLCEIPGMETDSELSVIVSLDRRSLAGELTVTARDPGLYVDFKTIFFARHIGACGAN